MARKARRIVLTVLLVLAGLLTGLVVGTELLLNSKALDRLVQKYVAEYIDGSLAYSRIRVSLFRSLPEVRLSIDTLSLTYPHERHSRWDVSRPNEYLQAGRGELRDTLASFARLDVVLDPFKLKNGRLEAKKLHLEGLRAFVHCYPDGTANWQMFNMPASSDSSSASPWIDVSSLLIDSSELVYTAPESGIYAKGAWQRLELRGSVKLEEGMALDKLQAELSGARLAGALGTLCADAAFDLAADSHGVLGADSFPVTSASMELRSCRLDYLPMKLHASLSLAADASMDEKGVVNAEVQDLLARTDGVRLYAEGLLKDALGADPRFRLAAQAYAKLDSLGYLLPSDAGMAASGRLDMDMEASGKLSDIGQNRFQNASVKGSIVSDKLEVRMPADTVALRASRPSISFVSGTDGLDFDIDADRLFLASGDNRVGLRSASVMFSAQKRVHARRPVADSTSRRRFRKVAESDLASHDIKLALDSTINSYLRQWKTSGHIQLEKGFCATPALPLRSRLTAFEASFDDSSLRLDTLAVALGSSDLRGSGTVGGLRRFLRNRGVLDLDFDLRANRLNVNEIVAAFEDNKGAGYEGTAEYDESFVTDEYAEAVPDSIDLGLIVLPGNISAKLHLRTEELNYTDVNITPLEATVRLQDRTLQLLDTRLATNYGNVELDAYYFTRSRSDIGAGVDIGISDVSANQLLHMLPAIDEMMPAIKTFQGKFSCEVSATTSLDNHMNVIMPSVDGLVRISGKDLYVEDAGNLRKITRLLLFKDKNIGRIDDFSVDAVVHDSKLEVFPFELGVDRYRMALHGRQDFDGTMNYHVSLLRSPYLILFGINIFGTFDNWRFSLGRARYRDGKVPAFTQKMDSVQVNIGKNIRNIFRVGVDNARQYNVSRIAALGTAGNNPYVRKEDDSLSPREMDAIDDLLVEDVMNQLAEELELEVDAVIQESLLHTGDLMAEYESLTYDKNVDKKIARLKKQADKKRRK